MVYLKENKVIENSNLNEKNLLISFLEFISGKLFVFLGVILMLFSAYPVIREMNSTSLIFLVLLVYSTGLFGSGFFIRKFLPWTGDVFYIINLLVTPVILSSASSLKFSENTDFLISGITIFLVPITSYIILKTLYKELQISYFIVFILLALSSVLPGYIEVAFSSASFLREDFETFISLLYFLVLLTGSLILNKHINIKNLKSNLLLNSLLIFVYMIIISTNNFGIQSYGLIAMFMSILLFLNIKKIQASPDYVLISKIELITLKRLTILAFLFSLISPALALFDITKLVIISFSGFILYLFISDLFSTKTYKLANQTLNGIFYISFIILLLQSWKISSDIQSFLLSLTTLFLIIAGNHHEFKKSKAILYFISITTSIVVWLKISMFDSWSLYTILSLFVLSVIYLFNSLYHKRNVLSYISLFTFTIVFFSLITVINPYMNFYYYRYYALLLSFLYLSIGYLVQLRYNEISISDKLQKKENSINLKKFFEKDIIRPYGLQDRFSSIIPYLISEPLYNLALFMTSISVLVNIKDYTIAILAALFYVCIFKIYPSRLWIYFALTASTDGFLNIITDVLPEKYQSWGFIILSFNWFFIGVIIEELFELYEREGKKLMYIDKKYAQPFFQGALIVNIFLLKYFFIDLLNFNSQEGWIKIEHELLQIAIISVLYLLKMRAYITKLWLFPCILVASIIIFFKSVSLFGAEYNLLVMTIIAFIWLGVGTFFNKSFKTMKYVKSIVDYKIPGLDINSNYYKYHIYDFASPFYIFAFLSAFVSLFISAILIPKYSILFATNLEFEVAKLNIVDINTFYFVQILNFVLIAVFFTVFFPNRILLLDGNLKDTIQPQSIKILPIISITLCFFWIYNFLLTKDDISLFISGITLIWTIFYGLSKVLHKKSVSIPEHNRFYYFISVFLGTISLILNFITSISNTYELNIIPSFSCLLLSFTILFSIEKASYLIYYIETTLFMPLVLLFYSGQLQWFNISMLIYSFAIINLIFQNSLSDNKLLDRFKELTNIFAISYLFSFNYLDENISYYTIAGFILYLIISKNNKLNFYPVLANIMLGISLYTLAISPKTYHSVLISIIFSYVSYFLILKNNNEFFNKFKKSLLIIAMTLLPAIFIGLFLNTRLYIDLGYIDLIKIYKFILIFSIILFYGLIAYTTKNQRLKKFCWWLTAILINFTEIAIYIEIFPPYYSVEYKNLMNLAFQFILTSIGISFLLLANIESNKKNKSDCIYFGQTFILFYPYYIYMTGSMFYSYDTKTIFLYLLMLCSFIGILIYLGFKQRNKAYLYFNLFIMAIFLSTELPLLFFNGEWFIRWGILISFGVLITISGIQIETNKEKLKNNIRHYSKVLQSWN